VGEHLWGRVDNQVLRMTTGLAGGVGGCQQELCGALSGGAMIIGAEYGRTQPEEDDSECDRLVCLYRDRFVDALGTARCCELRESGYGSDGQWPCSVLVERATQLLLKTLDEGRG
jgi:C_GCAxxG_C_C family probable redox protein